MVSFGTPVADCYSTDKYIVLQDTLSNIGDSEKLPHTSLSDREMEVFNLLVNGKTATEIGTLLHLSTKTISSHKSRILQKMNSSSLADLVRYAVTHDLLLPLRK